VLGYWGKAGRPYLEKKDDGGVKIAKKERGRKHGIPIGVIPRLPVPSNSRCPISQHRKGGKKKKRGARSGGGNGGSQELFCTPITKYCFGRGLRRAKLRHPSKEVDRSSTTKSRSQATVIEFLDSAKKVNEVKGSIMEKTNMPRRSIASHLTACRRNGQKGTPRAGDRAKKKNIIRTKSWRRPQTAQRTHIDASGKIGALKEERPWKVMVGGKRTRRATKIEIYRTCLPKKPAGVTKHPLPCYPHREEKPVIVLRKVCQLKRTRAETKSKWQSRFQRLGGRTGNGK